MLLGIKHILCLELNITLLQDLCPTHLSKIMSKGSDDISANINHKLGNALFSTLNLENKIFTLTPWIIMF